MSAVRSLNNYLVAQPSNHRVLLYIVLFIAILGIAYLFFFSDMLVEYEDKQNEVAQKETKLRQLQTSPKFANIKNLQGQIKKKEQEISKTQNSIDAKRSSLQNRSDTFVNDSKFAAFLEDTMTKSRSLKLVVEDITISSKKLPYIGLLEIKKVMQIKGSGGFKNILSLIRYVESQDMLFKLQALNIEQDGDGILSFDANFNVAGLL